MKDLTPQPAPEGAANRIAALVHTLRQTEEELHKLTGGKLDPDGKPYLLQSAQDGLRASESALRDKEWELRRLLQQLDDERARLLEAQRVAKMGSWETDLSSLVVFWSEEMYRIVETSEEKFEHTQAGFLAFVHPDDRARVEATFAQSIGQRGVFVDEHRLLLPDGKVKFVEERWRIFYNDQGQPYRAGGTTQDITARKEAEVALQESQNLMRMASRLTRMGAWSVKLPEVKITWSDEVCAIHEVMPGFDPTLEEGINFYVPESRETIARAFRDCVREGVPLDVELEIITAKNRRVWVRVLGEAVRDSDGKIIRVQGATQDISDRKQAAEQIRLHGEQLQASEEQYRLLFVANPLPMWVYDFESLRFLAVNEAAVEHYGYSETEFLGMTVLDIRPPGEADDYVRASRLRSPDGRRSVCDVHRKKDGTLIHVEITSDRVVMEGAPRRLTLINDITGRVMAERQAASAHRALRMLSRCNEALIRADSEEELLNKICQIAVEVGGARMAWVGYAQADTDKSIVPRAHAGDENGYLSKIRISWAEGNVTGCGSAGQVIRTGRSVTIADFSEVVEFGPWLEDAQARGFRGGICLPLKDRERTFGIFMIYLTEVRTVQPEELALLQELADDLAFGIQLQRDRVERQRIHEAILAMSQGVSTSMGQEFFEKLTLSMVEVLNAHAGFITQFVPPDQSAVRTIAAIVGGKAVPNFEYSLRCTPCEDLAAADEWVVPCDAQKLYPEAPALVQMAAEAYVGIKLLEAKGQPMGLIYVVFQQKLIQQNLVMATLQIFAVRAAAEMVRQSAEVQTREQAALLDKAQDAILVRDLEHRVTFWNRSAERIYGWTAAEITGRSMRKLLFLDPTPFDRAMETVLADGEWTGELEQTRKDGQKLSLECRYTLLRDETGRPKSVLAINTDITERKKLEQQFLRAQRMESIGTLAGGIAHDLNNLLAPITMGVELLRRFQINPRCLPVVDNIERSAKRGAELVKQVLSFARGVEGTRVALQVRHIVREIESIAENTFPKNILIEAVVPHDLRLIMADPTQLNQVVLNLCVNARDAMPDGGRLRIEAMNIEIDEQYAIMNHGVAPGHYVLIQVTDSGCGIPQVIIDRIFEPFFTTKELGKGTGLGLSTVMGIVRSHGGFVNVYSEVGKGSVFKVYLPALLESVEEGRRESEAEKFPRGNGELIMVVDDEASVLDITKQTLQTFGYKVITAEDGAHAIGHYALQRDEIALVLTDMMMPVMDGPALIAALRRINPKVKLIAASGLAANGNAVRAANIGVKHFLAKPYSADDLLQMLREALSERSSRPPI
jgi:PAS domain S-box-containing protein